MAPRETKNNAYAKFWGDKQRTLWYVTVISGVVNSRSVPLKYAPGANSLVYIGLYAEPRLTRFASSTVTALIGTDVSPQ